MNILLAVALAASASDWGAGRRTDAPAAAPAAPAAAPARALPPAPAHTREPMIDREEASRPALQRTADIIPLAKRGNQARGLATSEIGIPDYKPMALAAMPAASNRGAAAPPSASRAANAAHAAVARASRAGTRTTYGRVHAAGRRELLDYIRVEPDALTLDYDAKRHRFGYLLAGAPVVFFQLLDFDAKAPLPAQERWLVRMEDGRESVIAEPSPAPGRALTYASVLLSWDESKAMGERHHRLTFREDQGEIKTDEFYHSPLVLDLNGDGVRMSRRSAAFDAGGALVKDAVHDISKADGLLVFDADRDGTAGEGGQEAFGTATDLDGDRRPDGHADGFAALKSLVARAAALGAVSPAAASSGRLDAAALRGLARVYGLAVKVGGVSGRVVSLEEAGVTELRLPTASCSRQKDFDGQGNEVLRCAGAEFVNADGATRAYEDVFFQLDWTKT